MTSATRSLQQRRRDTLHRLQHDVDAWIATADPDTCTPYLVPLSLLWDGTDLVVATPTASITGRNLRAASTVRVGLGPTRDVVMIEATVTVLAMADVTAELGDTFAAKTQFDPRELTTPYTYFRLGPRRIQAWREADELSGRELMRAGDWLV